MGAYAFFVKICREEHKKRFPDEVVEFNEFTKKCAERWKTAFNKFSDVEKQINRIESIMIGVAGTLILGGVSTIGTIVMMHS